MVTGGQNGEGEERGRGSFGQGRGGISERGEFPGERRFERRDEFVDRDGFRGQSAMSSRGSGEGYPRGGGSRPGYSERDYGSGRTGFGGDDRHHRREDFGRGCRGGYSGSSGRGFGGGWGEYGDSQQGYSSGRDAVADGNSEGMRTGGGFKDTDSRQGLPLFTLHSTSTGTELF